MSYRSNPWVLHGKTLRTCNLLEMDKFCDKLVPYIVDGKHTNFDKNTSLALNL
jgi:hypothetical protein